MKKVIVGAVALAIGLAACADPDGETAANEIEALASPGVEEIAAIDVKSANIGLGDVLVGPEGLTLYGFTNDVDATSACYGTCADAWPPVIVDVDWTAGPGLDFGIFATTVREDGQLQLVAGQWPLYYFAGDGAPGDVNGQGSGDVWFAVDTDGRLITEASAVAADTTTDDAEEGDAGTAATAEQPAAALVSVATTGVGDALVDESGLTLYGFLNDVDGVPSCDDACADAWPPVLVGGPDLPDGLDPAVFSVATRSDGSFQLSAGVWPLYRFAGDGAAGDVNGQGSGDVWFVAAPDGSLVGASELSSADSSTESGDDGESDGSRDY